MKNNKKVVVIGGAAGSAIMVNALKRFADKVELAAVTAMSDSGRSTIVWRNEFGMLPPADILRVALAFSPYDFQVLRKIFYTNRCTELPKLGKLFSHTTRPNLGTIFLTFLAQYEGGVIPALRALEEVVEAIGRVYPVTLTQNDLCAELSNGTIIKGEGAIDRPTYDRAFKIKRVWLEPQALIYDEAGRVLKQADYIFLSPGSLYTSVIATLLPVGAKEAVAQSQAKLIYVAGDAYELNGETGPERLSDFVKQLEGYLPRPVDLVIYNNSKLTKLQHNKYEEKQWGSFAKDVEHIKNKEVMGVDFEKEVGGLSPEKLSNVLQPILWK